MIFTLKNEELFELNESSTPNFPKYTSQLINWAKSKRTGYSSKSSWTTFRFISGVSGGF
jgi:hypothetical protein